MIWAEIDGTMQATVKTTGTNRHLRFAGILRNGDARSYPLRCSTGEKSPLHSKPLTRCRYHVGFQSKREYAGTARGRLRPRAQSRRVGTRCNPAAKTLRLKRGS